MKFIILLCCISCSLFSLEKHEEKKEYLCTDCYEATVYLDKKGNLYVYFDGFFIAIDEWRFPDIQ